MGISLWNCAGIGLCDEGDVGIEFGGDGIGDWVGAAVDEDGGFAGAGSKAAAARESFAWGGRGGVGGGGDFVFGIVYEHARSVGCDQDLFDVSSSQHRGGGGGDCVCAGGESGVSGVADQLQILRGSAIQPVFVFNACRGFHAVGGSD